MWFEQARLLQERGQPAAALAVIAELTSDEPAVADGWLAQGILLGELGDAAGARQALGQAARALRLADCVVCEQDPRGTLLFNRACAHAALADDAAARAALAAAVAIDGRWLQAAQQTPALAPLCAEAALTIDVERAETATAVRTLALDLTEALTAWQRDARDVDLSPLRELLLDVFGAALQQCEDAAPAVDRRALLQQAEPNLAALAMAQPAILRGRAEAMDDLLAALAAVLGVGGVAD